MKYVFLAIFVLLSAQPLQASFCDMETAQTIHHEHSEDGHKMDCCDDPTEADDECATMDHCGGCTIGTLSVGTSSMSMNFMVGTRQCHPDYDNKLSNINAPPLKPPII
jgi:hypothetical protein